MAKQNLCQTAGDMAERVEPADAFSLPQHLPAFFELLFSDRVDPVRGNFAAAVIALFQSGNPCVI